MRGKVLLRASEYQWITRIMDLGTDSLLFYEDLAKATLESVDLIGATCEVVVVSSEHLHCFRVVEVDPETKATKEWILDARTSQDKQNWISSIQTTILNLKKTTRVAAEPAVDIEPNSGIDRKRINAARRLVHDLQAQRGSLFLRGKDVLDILQKHVGCNSRTEALVLGNTLLNEGYLKHMVSQYTLLDDDCLFETVSRTQYNLHRQFHYQRQDDGSSDDEDEANNVNQTNGYYCPELHNLFVSMLIEIEIFYVVEDPRPNESMSMSAVDLDLDFSSFDAAKELTLKECFYGNDAVTCLMSVGLLNEQAALVLGNQLLARGYFSPMDSETISFENARTRYVLSPDVTRSIAPTAEETIMDLQCQEEKYRTDLRAAMDVRHQGLQWLCVSMAALLLFDSLQEMSFAYKVVFVALSWLGKLYLHDPHAVLPTTVPTIGQYTQLPRPKRSSFSAPVETLQPAAAEGDPRHRSGSTATLRHRFPSNADAKPVAATTLVALSAEDRARLDAFKQMLSFDEDSAFLFTDEYLFSVLNVKNRTMNYAAEKLQRCIAWRQEYGAPGIVAADVVGQFAGCSMYWYGYDYNNRPIFWARPKRKDWSKMDAAVEIRAHVFMIELGVKYMMPPGCTTFTFVTDCANVGYREVDIRLMKGLMEVCSGNYPDRIGAICIGPLTTLVKTLTRMLAPLLPARLREKAKFMKSPGKELEEFMPPEYIPTFMGGKATHKLNPDGHADVFDFDYMLSAQQERMKHLPKKVVAESSAMANSYARPQEGMQWLAMSFLVILFLDSLAEVTFVQKIVLVLWSFLGKVYLHDLRAVEVVTSPAQYAPCPRRLHIPRKKSLDLKGGNPQEAITPLVTPLPSPRSSLHPSLSVDIQTVSASKACTSVRSTSLNSEASTICESPSPSPASSRKNTDCAGMSDEDAARVDAFRKMLNATDDAQFLLSDEYLLSVLNVPNRTIEYAVEKLNRVLAWRIEYRASSITPAEVAPQLASGSMYWFGYDNKRRPILWLRPKKKDWTTMDKDLEIRTHVFMLELGIRELMPPGVSTFTLVSDCANVGYREVDVRLTKAMIEVCQGNYPDRIDHICVGPLTLLVKTLTKIISPLLPARLREKALFMDQPSTDLLQVMPAKVIPTFFGGSAEHLLHPTDQSKYDFNFMLASQRQRLQTLIESES
ncbi:hypothetical protein ACHHYP_00477 [Achlya hypogyna]|uniref:CRAL-TRIO domain-containing protein n=1 Tax=Achlya hypogyna TaxID=1202772 RepID=A0A1V9ZAP8_ACHHY|nr:hypothetical protein ACHHYP_00477 [Achlya hypogyna]